MIELADEKDKLVLMLGYSQYKFIIEDFLEAEVRASDNMKEAEILLKRKETEDLGWLIIKKNLSLCTSVPLARNHLKQVILDLESIK